MVVLSKILLSATKHFVFTSDEMMSKEQAEPGHEFHLVSEILLPPLADTDDRGALVLVVWDNNGDFDTGNNNNAIFEVFVDTMDTVHDTWLLHSRDVNSNRVCANLHASIMTSCNGRISDVAQYNFVNIKLVSATFKKITILPKKQPTPGIYDTDNRPVACTIIGLLDSFVEYTSNSEPPVASTCKVELELT